MSAPDTLPASRALLEKTIDALTLESAAAGGDDDRRLGVVFNLEENWAADDRRFAAASALLGHDRRVAPQLEEALSLICGIVDTLEDLFLDYEEPVHDRAALAPAARELRNAVDRVSEIAYAVSAVPLLSE
jgi:hypothetical protein